MSAGFVGGARCARAASALAVFLIMSALMLDPASASQGGELDQAEAVRALASARAAMAQRDWGTAELLLERALLLHPDSVEALIELAQLLAHRGRTTESLAIAVALRADTRITLAQARDLAVIVARVEKLQKAHGATVRSAAPETHSAVLDPQEAAARRRRPDGALPTVPEWRWRLEAQLGRSSNPKVLTAARSIDLTLPDGTLQLPLESRPVAAGYAGATVSAVAPLGTEFLVQVQQLALPNQQPALRAGALWPLGALAIPAISAAAAPDVGAALALRLQRYPDGTQRTQADVHLALATRWAMQVGFYEEPDRVRRGSSARLEWSVPAAIGQSVAWLEGEGNRASGAPGWWGYGLRWAQASASGWSWQAQLQTQQDTAGYNPLLEYNARRVLKTGQLSLDRPIGSLSQDPLRIRLYFSKRISNLALFSWTDSGLQLIYQRAW
jgi:hypothetical protein